MIKSPRSTFKQNRNRRCSNVVVPHKTELVKLKGHLSNTEKASSIFCSCLLFDDPSSFRNTLQRKEPRNGRFENSRRSSTMRKVRYTRRPFVTAGWDFGTLVYLNFPFSWFNDCPEDVYACARARVDTWKINLSRTRKFAESAKRRLLIRFRWILYGFVEFITFLNHWFVTILQGFEYVYKE